jgi:hypothetical protein
MFQINMSNCYSLSNQKLLHKINVLDRNINFLKRRTLTSPCITITKFYQLQIGSLMKHTSVKPSVYEIIQKLFSQLNIPQFWIHSIEIQHSTTKPYYLPSTVNIYLVADNIKMFVYNTLLNYLKHTNQKSVTVSVKSPITY